MRPVSLYLLLAAVAACVAGCRSQPWPPGLQEVPASSPALTPEEALETFILAPGFEIELVASEPLVQAPVAIDFDADGRLWVVEMRSYMPNVDAEGELVPTGRVSVLEDLDADGRMDRSTVFLDSLYLPRAIKVLDRGALIGEPPYLWIARDTTGDLVADHREIVRDDFGVRESNPERNPNGLVWTIDNALESVWYDVRLEMLPGGRLQGVRTLHVGQWGITMDDFGIVYRNWNEGPLYADYVPAHYLARNANLVRQRAAYVDIVADDTVWPIRPNWGVNRGYRESVLREDGTLRAFTSAGSPVAFRGDRLPEDVVNDVFVGEPAGNLVRRFQIVGRGSDSLYAENVHEKAEFLASTDERFRPVNLSSAPDGTLYVVDMYRGIIQHREYLTEYLEDQIRRRNLDEPLGLGRIYRIVHEDHEPGPAPSLSDATVEELVSALSHPNGWWRDTAQRLLIERNAVQSAPLVRLLARDADDERVRLHALWTLEGLDEMDDSTLGAAFQDRSSYVRAAAVRIAEGSLPPEDILQDASPIVYRQLAASLSALPEATHFRSLRLLLERRGDDPATVDAAISGLAGSESAFLDYLLQESDREILSDAIAMTAAAALKSGDESVLRRVGNASAASWQRASILQGVLVYAPEAPDEGEGWAGFEPLALSSPPEAIIAAADREDEIGRMAADALERFTWPGKARPERPRGRPLTEEEQVRFDFGREVYADNCSACHGEDGRAAARQGLPLVGSKWVLGDRDPLIRIVLHGKEGESLMPPMRSLTDEEIAAVLTYIRRAWSNRASPVTAGQVKEVRGRTASRSEPWTEAELVR